MKIVAAFSNWDIRLGERPLGFFSRAWFGRRPFEDTSALEGNGVSYNLVLPAEGVTHGHNVARDSNVWDGMLVDREVPLSPLFVRDLAGRPVYIGSGPEAKLNGEWDAYMPPQDEDGLISSADFNPVAPLIVFPRHCRDLAAMPGRELVEHEHVLFATWRAVEMARGYHARLSGSTPDDDLVATTYAGANVYPYKLRLDTFYPDGYRLPQVQMLFARGDAQGIDPYAAKALGDDIVAHWNAREPGLGYEAWREALGDEAVEDMFMRGCTLIPTLEACNGFAVVSRQFELVDFWPGRAVVGLHEIMDTRIDQAPAGTILEVVRPGFITGWHIVPAQVVVSDGSGYVSPNAEDPLPTLPNLNLPHSRTVADWRMCWIPTHPEHFEAPAMWGWEPESGRYMQLSGPLWDPLHYVYACTDILRDAYDNPQPLPQNPALLPVPKALVGRFWPVIPLKGFDTFDVAAPTARRARSSKISSMIVRTDSDRVVAGIGYHPLPAEFEFEFDPFWHPELHPLNRGQGIVPEDLEPRICPVIEPAVAPDEYVASVRGADERNAPWLLEKGRLIVPSTDPIQNYPALVRYLISDLDIRDIIRLCPTPVLGDMTRSDAEFNDINLLDIPAERWWQQEDGQQLDSPDALSVFGAGVYEDLWDARQNGVLAIKFRHLVYQTNLPLYILGWWYGVTIPLLETMQADWMTRADDIALDTVPVAAAEDSTGPAS